MGLEELKLRLRSARTRPAGEPVKTKVMRVACDAKVLLDETLREIHIRGALPQKAPVAIRLAILDWVAKAISDLSRLDAGEELDALDHEREFGDAVWVDVAGSGSEPEERLELETAIEAVLEMAQFSPDSIAPVIEEAGMRLLAMAEMKRRH